MTNEKKPTKETTEETSIKAPEEYVEQLCASSRRERQNAAHELADIAQNNPTALLGFVSNFIDALSRPEAQTRWEMFDALSYMAPHASKEVAPATDDAEEALFDENSSMVRVSAYRFLCSWGATSPKNSDTVWPLIEEAAQCYHGDPAFQDMLAATLEFAKGKLSAQTKKKLVKTATFDAQNSTVPIIKAYAEQILDTVSPKK